METTAPIPTRRPAAVYRLFDAAGTLLYVGSSFDPEDRCKDHHKQPWWPQVARRTDEWHDTRATAFAAEMRAIRSSRPEHNQVGTPKHAAQKRREASRTPGKWRVAYDANRLRHAVVRRLTLDGYPGARATATGMMAERAYKEASGLFPKGVAYPSLDQIADLLRAA